MVDFTYDLVVIGAGSGGVAAARRAASYGVKVALCEARDIGGTCVNRGCVPKKHYVYAGEFADAFNDAKGYGWSVGSPKFSWETLQKNVFDDVRRLNQVYETLVADTGVDYYKGHAQIAGSEIVEVDDKRLRAKYILIATGAHPFMPDVQGIEYVMSSDEAFHMPTLPKSIAIVGGGYIASEFACIFNALGVDVTMVIRGNDLLRGFDDDIRSQLANAMRKRGIKIQCETVVSSIERKENQYKLNCSQGYCQSFDKIMYATGRKPNIAGLGLQRLNVEVSDRGLIVVDDQLQTNIPGVYAVGDCCHALQLTPVAIAEGRAFVERMFKGKKIQVERDFIPTAIFCQPPAATVGLTQQAAEEQGYKVKIFKTEFRSMKMAVAGRDEKTFMKLIVCTKTDKVLGCHIAGHDAPEMIQGFAVAMKCGAKKADFDRTIGIHPSAAEELLTL